MNTLYLYIIVATLYLGILIFASYKLGIITWLIGMLIIPASIGTILAEVDIARGALSMLTGSELGSMVISFSLAVGLLFSSHWLASCILKSRFHELHMPSILLVMLIILFGWLGMLRVELVTSFLPDDIITQSKYIFFIYPFISLTLGFALAATIRPIEQKFKRAHLSALLLMSKKSEEDGSAMVAASELVDKLEFSHDKAINYVLDESEFFAKLTGEPDDQAKSTESAPEKPPEAVVIEKNPEIEEESPEDTTITNTDANIKPEIPVKKPVTTKTTGTKIVTKTKKKFVKEIHNPYREIRKTNRKIRNKANKKVVPLK